MVFHAIYVCRWVGASRSAPSVDPNQDVTMTMAEQVNGRTIISFTRSITTDDAAPTDVSLANAVFILWAVGPEVNFDGTQSNSIMYHGTSRGASGQMIAIDCTSKNKYIPAVINVCLLHMKLYNE